MLEDAEVRRRLGGAAAELAAKYAWPVIGERFGEVLRRVVGQQVALAAS